MNAKLIVGTCGLVSVLMAAGCQAPLQPTSPTMTEVRADDFEALWLQCAQTLRRHNFAPDRQDRRLGVMTSYPDVSAQVFEPWWDNTPGGYQTLEANISTIRRQVEVRIEPIDREQSEYRVSVRVEKFRFSAPERQVTTASGALQIFGEKLPTTAGERAGREEGAHWVSLGRDGMLERKLLAEIAERFPGVESGTEVGAASPPVNRRSLAVAWPA